MCMRCWTRLSKLGFLGSSFKMRVSNLTFKLGFKLRSSFRSSLAQEVGKRL